MRFVLHAAAKFELQDYTAFHENIINQLPFGTLTEKRGLPDSDADITVIRKRYCGRPDKFALDYPVDKSSFTLIPGENGTI